MRFEFMVVLNQMKNIQSHMEQKGSCARIRRCQRSDGFHSLCALSLMLASISFFAAVLDTEASVTVHGEHVFSASSSQPTAAYYTPQILADDLIDASQPSLLNWSRDKTPFFESTTLNDGIGCPPSGDAKGTYLPATYSGGRLPITYTFNFDTSVNTLGYDIAEIRSYAGWHANGSALGNQKYELLVSTIDTADFISLGTFAYAPFGNSDPNAASATKMVLTASGGGAITTRVDAIRFVIMDHGYKNGNTSIDGSVFYEIDVIGSPSASAITATYVYDGSGQGALPNSSWPDSGGIELTNGKLPATPHYTDPEWVGFRDDPPDDGSCQPQVTFTLSAPTEIRNIEVVYFHSTGQAGGSITAPDTALVSLSVDGTIWADPVAFTKEFDDSAGDEIRMARLYVRGLASYVRLDFRNTSQWTFLAEVRFNTGSDYPSHVSLSLAIAAAQTLHDTAVEGSADGEYPIGSKAQLQTAIVAAAAVDGNPEASQQELEAAETALDRAVREFRESVNGGLPMLNHILGTGQSLSVGWNGGPPLTTTQPYANLMLSDVGQTGTELVPLIEGPNLRNAQVETISSALANTLTALSPASNYTSIVTRHGDGSMAYSNLKKGTALYGKGMDQVAKAQSAALAQGYGYRVAAVTTVHGESDHLADNGPAYAGYLKEWQSDYDADCKALTGQAVDVPMFLCQMSSHTKYNSATSLIPGAQLWAAENSRYHYLVCPKYFLTYSDGVHLNAQSYRHLGEYYGKALKRVLVEGVDWQPLTPVRIVREGVVITVDFHVPVPPLVFDTALVLAQANYGFEYTDDSSSALISSVVIADENTVTVTLSNLPTGLNQRLRYAYTGTAGSWAGCNQAGSARGNVRDSDSTPSLYGSNLYNWLVHFDHPVPYDPAWDDFDGDGVPDRWEYLNFGSTNVSHGLGSNADGDPMDDYGEWVTGTDPNDPDDYFRINGRKSQSGAGFEVSWSSVAQREYTLARTATLTDGFSWSKVLTAVGTGHKMAYTNTLLAEPRLFFRVEVNPE